MATSPEYPSIEVFQSVGTLAYEAVCQHCRLIQAAAADEQTAVGLASSQILKHWSKAHPDVPFPLNVNPMAPLPRGLHTSPVVMSCDYCGDTLTTGMNLGGLYCANKTCARSPFFNTAPAAVPVPVTVVPPNPVIPVTPGGPTYQGLSRLPQPSKPDDSWIDDFDLLEDA